MSHTYTNGETEATITIHGDLPAFAIDVVDPNNRNALIQLVADMYGMPFADIESMLSVYTTAQLYELLILQGVPLIPSPFNSKLLEITNLGDLHWQNLDYAFANQSLLTKVSGGDLTNVTSMKSTFLAAGYNMLAMPANTNSEFTLKNIDLASIPNNTNLFWGPSNGSHIIIEGTTTDFSGDLTTGGFWPRIWCLDWSGTEFGGVTCQKVAYPGP